MIDVITENEAKQLNPNVLAYLGDAVYTLYVREKNILSKGDKLFSLHKATCDTVKASAQAEAIQKIMPILTEDELSVYKRARNTKKNTKAKNSSVAEYNMATGLESLLGYLYITGQRERLIFLIELAINKKED